MSTILQPRTIRCKATFGGKIPGQTLADTATGQIIATYRGNATTFQFGFFGYADGLPMELDDVQSLNLKIQPTQIPGGAVLADQTLAAGDLDLTLTAGTWTDGSKQHAAFAFTNAEMNLDPQGARRTLWLVITALMTGGEEVTLAAGTMNLHEDNSAAADPPPENPGTAVTLEQGDARWGSATTLPYNPLNADEYGLNVSGTLTSNDTTPLAAPGYMPPDLSGQWQTESWQMLIDDIELWGLSGLGAIWQGAGSTPATAVWTPSGTNTGTPIVTAVTRPKTTGLFARVNDGVNSITLWQNFGDDDAPSWAKLERMDFQELVTQSGAVTLDWQACELLDPTGDVSLDWQNRMLRAHNSDRSDMYTAAEWAGEGDSVFFRVNFDFRIQKTNAAGTGAQTIHQNAGSVQFAAGAASLVVTNTRVTANSIIIATVASNDANMKSVSAVPANGSFTLRGNATPSGLIKVNWLVIN